MHCIMQGRLIAGGKDTKEGQQIVFFSALDPLGDELDQEYQDSPKPRKVQYKSKWKVTQDAIFWINLRKAQDEGLTFWQTRSHAVILYDSVSDEAMRGW